MAFDVKEEAKKQFSYAVEKRRYIHENPRPSFQEDDTRDFLIEELKRLGADEVRVCGRKGVLASVYGNNQEEFIAFRADFDALPVTEQTGVPFASKNVGVMHACGHDNHTAMLLTFAKSLLENRAELDKSVRLIFQDDEEKQPGGAIDMIKDGCLDKVVKVYGLHVEDGLKVGEVGVKDGGWIAGSGVFEFKINGKGCHGAMPYLGDDCITTVSHAIINLNSITSRMCGPGEESVISVCYINGDSNFNVLPPEVKFGGTSRAFNMPTLDKLKEKMEQAVKAACTTFSTDYEFTYDDGYPPLINHKECSDVVRKAARDIDIKCIEMERTFICEDFARYLEKVPGAFFRLGINNGSEETSYPLHHPKFNVDEEALKYGLEMFWSIYLNEN